MNKIKPFLLAGVWTLLVLTPFAISTIYLKNEVKIAVLFFFFMHFLRRWIDWRILHQLKYALLFCVMFSSFTGLFYKIFVYVKFDCAFAGCSGSQELSTIATLTSLVTVFFIAVLVWRRGHYIPTITRNLPLMVDSAGVTALIMYFSLITLNA